MDDYILNLATVSSTSSVALYKKKVLVASKVSSGRHSQVLVRLVSELMAEGGVTFSQLVAVATLEGPGSYTGLRVGAAFAKGLLYGSDTPLITINTLQAYYQPGYPAAKQYALLHAGRKKAYGMVLDQDGVIVHPTHGVDLALDSFSNWLAQGKIYFVGDESTLALSTLGFSSEDILTPVPLAQGMGRWSYQKWQQKEYASLARFQPSYLSAYQI